MNRMRTNRVLAIVLILVMAVAQFAFAGTFDAENALLYVDNSQTSALNPGDTGRIDYTLTAHGKMDVSADVYYYTSFTINANGTVTPGKTASHTFAPQTEANAKQSFDVSATVTLSPDFDAATTLTEKIFLVEKVVNSGVSKNVLNDNGKDEFLMVSLVPTPDTVTPDPDPTPNPDPVNPQPDTTAPVFTSVPSNLEVEATAVLTQVDLGSAAATDNSGAAPSVTNNAPADGYAIGTTEVTWTATDAAGNSSTAKQNITVKDTTAPVLNAPADVTKEASAILTPVDLGDASASDIFAVTVTNTAQAAYAYGKTIVNWTATDANGNFSTAAQVVTITDTTAPELTVPAAVIKEATAELTPAELGSASATDIFEVTVSNDAPAAFAYGTTDVTWTATDEHGNSTTAVQKVTITDTTAPTLSVPADKTVVLTGALTKVDLGTATASDIFGATVSNNAPADGFKIGTNYVTWTATDPHGNSTTAVQKVTVKYNYGGILQPINTDGSSVFKIGSTLPVKFQLKNASGSYVSTAVATISVAKVDSTAGTVNEVAYTAAANTGNLFRYDATSNQYIFNLGTKGFTTGTYRISVTLDDGSVYKVEASTK